MTTEEINNFVESMTFEDSTVRLFNKTYWCLGLSWNEEKKKHYISVMEADPNTYEGLCDLFFYESESRDDCMKHFLEDKYWEGKSFYEVANDMEWIDL